MTNVMTNAWKIAYEGVEKFGGQVKEYFAEALRIAWGLFKKGGSKMELVKEVAFGKATARITVKGTFSNETLHQFAAGGEVLITRKIEVIHNGKVVGESRHISPMEYNVIYDKTYEERGLDISKTYSQVEGVGICEGRETADTINALIKEMEEEITIALKGETEQKEGFAIAESAKEIVKAAEQQGIENLKTKSEIKEWSKRYNEVVNEGGEGYIPQLVSKEQYEYALQVLNNEG